MSAVCTCLQPHVYTTEHGHKACHRCGYWWMPEHGSLTVSEANIIRHRQRALASMPKPPTIARNACCPCGSQRKYKKCHGDSAVMARQRQDYAVAVARRKELLTNGPTNNASANS